MADQRISQLPVADPIDGTELLAIVQAAVTKRMPISALTTIGVLSSLTVAGNTSLGGGTFVFNDAAGDYDFRVEGTTDQNLIRTDASTNNVGIGVAAPTEKLDVAGSINLATGNAIKINGTSVLNATTLGAGVTASSLTSVGTLTSLNVSGSASLNGTTIPANSTLVTTTATQTLTNKTLDDYTNNIGANSTHFRIKATGNISKGSVVKATGYNPGEQAIEVAVVTSATDLALGISEQALTTGQFGLAVVIGELFDVNTNGFTVGAIIYSNGAGGFTETKPASGLYQPLGWIVRANSSNGVIAVNIVAPLYVEASTNIANTIVLRDGSGNFAAGTLTLAGLSVDSPTLVVDAANNRVGFGTVTPAATVHSVVADGGYAFAGSGTTKGFRFETNATETRLVGVDNTLGASFQPLSIGGSYVVVRTNGTTEAVRIDASGNVGIGTASPGGRLHVTASGVNSIFDSGAAADGRIELRYNGVRQGLIGFDSGIVNIRADLSSVLRLGAGNADRWSISTAGHFLAITDASFDIGASGTNRPRDLYLSSNAFASGYFQTLTRGTTGGFRTSDWHIYNSTSGNALLIEQGSNFVRINSDGNVGLGFIPGAWGSDTKAIQLGGSTFSAFAANLRFLGLANATWDGTNYRYINTASAQQYRMSAGTGTHEWYIAPSGTAGAAITFTQAMTLDSSGNLLVGTTSAGLAAAGRGLIEVNGTTTALYGLRVGGTNVGYLSASSSVTELGAIGASQPLAFIANGAERMRLDASGNLGIGTTTPSSFARFAVLSGATANTAFLASTTANAYSASSFFSDWSLALRSAANATGNATAIRFASSANGAYEGLFGFVQNASTYGDFVWQSYNGSYGERMRLDASGNLGLGVTPSAWGASFKALQVSTASLWSSGGSNALVGANYYHDGTNRRYISTAAATEYGQSGGSHIWYTAPSGTAGTAITFTQAMTLDASGNLSLGSNAGSSFPRIFAKQAAANQLGVVSCNSAGNLEARLFHNGTVGGIAVSYQSSGSFTPLAFYTSDTERWQINTSGHFLAGADATYDIGASGANRPRTVFAATSIVAPTLTGTLSTAAQPNVTSFGTLSSLTVSGNTGVATTGSAIAGVGATSAGTKLNVQAAAGGQSLRLTDATNSTLQIDHPSSGVTRFRNGADVEWMRESNNNVAFDTNTLYVDAANNRVGVGTASPSLSFDLLSPTAGAIARFKSTQSVASVTVDTTSAGGGGSFAALQNGTTRAVFGVDGTIQGNTSSDVAVFAETGSSLKFYTNGSPTVKATLDTSGNLGLGATPSANGSIYYKSIELGKAGCGLFAATSFLTASELTYLTGNAVLTYDAGPKWLYGSSGPAATYGIEDGNHKWFVAPSGTNAGDTITFGDPKMALDVNGNLNVAGAYSVNSTTAIQRKDFGYNATWKAIQIGTSGSSVGNVALAVDVSTIAGGAFAGQNQVVIPAQGLLMPNAAGTNFIGVLARNASNSLLIGPQTSGGITTGDLVITTGGNVGIGTASPGATFHVNAPSGSNTNIALSENDSIKWYIGNVTGSSTFRFYDNTAGAERLRIDASGNLVVTTGNLSVASGSVVYLSGAGGNAYLQESGGSLFLGAGGAGRFQVTSAGNAGLGVAPSAWGTTAKALQVDSRTAIWQQSNVSVFSNNVYAATGGNTYIATAAATQYYQDAGAHVWRTAPSGTAGNAITFTQAMTLEADADLGLNVSSVTAIGSNITTMQIRGRTVNDGGGIRFDTSDASHIGLAYIGNAGMDIGTSTNTPLRFFTGSGFTERARITSGGYTKASDAGTYVSSTGTYHEMRQSAADYTLYNSNTHASGPYGIYQRYTAASPNGTLNWFLICEDSTAIRANIRSNGGLANYQSNNVDLSDARTKTDITPAASMWSKIGALEIVTYKYTDQTHDDVNVGVIAQQVETVEPVWVDADGMGETPADGVPLKTVYTKDITFAAIKALQEAMARIESLEARLAVLEAQP